MLMSYDAFGVADSEELRDKLFEQKVRMRIMPKRLLRLALEQAGFELDPTQHEGQVAVLWGDDVVAPANVLYNFAKDKENIQILAGAMEGKVLTQEQVQALAQLPSKDQLRAQVVSTIAGPLRGLVGVLSGTQRGLLYALQGIAQAKQ